MPHAAYQRSFTSIDSVGAPGSASLAVVRSPPGIVVVPVMRLSPPVEAPNVTRASGRSEEHTSELQSLMRISYAVFCLKKKTNRPTYIARSTNNQRFSYMKLQIQHQHTITRRNTVAASDRIL